jgi:hypothetical protein
VRPTSLPQAQLDRLNVRSVGKDYVRDASQVRPQLLQMPNRVELKASEPRAAVGELTPIQVALAGMDRNDQQPGGYADALAACSLLAPQPSASPEREVELPSARARRLLAERDTSRPAYRAAAVRFSMRLRTIFRAMRDTSRNAWKYGSGGRHARHLHPQARRVAGRRLARRGPPREEPEPSSRTASRRRPDGVIA